ncbi:MAG: ABC-type transporter, integral rane subunit [Microbacteriaceae bacterium]|jgi:branched-chain amino acid transport system permease protein|nr:ABC-type transporter, integral rane subunit [Microbacteriaceae bacterium]
MDLAFFIQLFVTGVTTGAIYAAVAMGFVLVFRVTGILNFAQGELLMVGGMLIISFREAGWPLYAAIPVTIALVFLLGCAIYALALGPAIKRGTNISLLLITLGISQVLQGLAQIGWGSAPRYTGDFSPTAHPISVLSVSITTQSIWILGGVLVALGATYLVLERTGIGRALRASSIDPMMARLSGINVRMVSLIAFGAAGALAAVGGLLLAPVIGMTYATGSLIGVKGIAAAVIGGFGSIPGAIIGGIALGLLESLASLISTGLTTGISLLAVVIVLLILPNGILGGRRVKAAVGV